MTDRNVVLRRLRRGLAEDLLAGTDPAHVDERAHALGHDLSLRHQVVVAHEREQLPGDLLDDILERAAAELELGTLLGRRAGGAVLLAMSPPSARQPATFDELHSEVHRQLPTTVVSIGVGGDCHGAPDIPRSWREAQWALVVRRSSRLPDGVTIYARTEGPDLGGFVRGPLGPLLDYDAEHGTELIASLSAFLAADGDYLQAAARLSIHRSTLRYRMWRIRELTGVDFGDAESRANLQVAQ